MKLWKFDSGIYPVIPGLDISLGDYGYWEGTQWCKVGNLHLINGCPRVFSVIAKELNQEITESLEVNISVSNAADANVDNQNANLKLHFNKSNSQYFHGILRKSEEFCSIGSEIFPYLKKLRDEGVWQSEYWLAYYVLQSDRFFTLRSKVAGAEVNLNAGLNLTEIKSKASLASALSYDSKSIESVSFVGNSLQFAGAKFISLQEKGVFKRVPKIIYNTLTENLCIY